jgi:hypothetical protein
MGVPLPIDLRGHHGTATNVATYAPKSCCPLGVGLLEYVEVADVVVVALGKRYGTVSNLRCSFLAA